VCYRCNEPRYKDMDNKKGPLTQLFVYRSITSWARYAFGRKSFAELARYHTSEDGRRGRASGEVNDIYDGELWKDMVTSDEVISSDPRNLILALCTDGVLAFSDNHSYSVWPIYITPYNLPQSARKRLGVTTLVGVIAGKKEEKANLDLQPVLQLVVDELNFLYMVGAEVHDAYTGEDFVMRAKLVHAISDLRGLQKITNMKSSPATYSCYCCWLKGHKIASKGKTIYPGNWRFLDDNHWLRPIACKFNLENCKDAANKCHWSGEHVHVYVL
jgi:Transposase family tnp2